MLIVAINLTCVRVIYSWTAAMNKGIFYHVCIFVYTDYNYTCSQYLAYYEFIKMKLYDHKYEDGKIATSTPHMPTPSGH